MRIIEAYQDYFWDFYNQQPQPVKDKIDYVLQIIIEVERVPKKFFNLDYAIEIVMKAYSAKNQALMLKKHSTAMVSQQILVK